MTSYDVTSWALLREDRRDVEGGTSRLRRKEKLGRPRSRVARHVVDHDLVAAAGADREAQSLACVTRACGLDHVGSLLLTMVVRAAPRLITQIRRPIQHCEVPNSLCREDVGQLHGHRRGHACERSLAATCRSAR